jgi:transcriptional regulator with PAS, ATPase and Fis domain
MRRIRSKSVGPPPSIEQLIEQLVDDVLRDVRKAILGALRSAIALQGDAPTPAVRKAPGDRRPHVSARLSDLPLGGQSLARIEREAIRQALTRSRGSRTAAARSLGIAISTLYEKVKKYDI